jgi:hypothetical protein
VTAEMIVTERPSGRSHPPACVRVISSISSIV